MSASWSKHSHTRKSSIYVEVPPSPLNLASYRAFSTATPFASAHVPGLASSKLKENTPLRPHKHIMAQTQFSNSLSSLKRKLGDRDTQTNMIDGALISVKKLKLVSTNEISLVSKQAEEETCNSDFPNGFIYCHQCNKKRDKLATLQCTFLELRETRKNKPPIERRCINKFCRQCLKNRYNVDMDELKNNMSQEEGHAPDVEYNFKCPKCSDMCNCPRCRKSKGLEPMGALGTLTKKASFLLIPNAVIKPEKKPKATSSNRQPIPAALAPKAKLPAVKKSKAKPLPTLKWTELPVTLSLEEGKERFQIREFIIRFSAILDPPLPKAQLEELEEIGGKRRRDEDDEMTPWVSELCVRAVILGLLGLLAKESYTELSQAIKTAIKDIKAASLSLNKIWFILCALRESASTLGLSSAPSNSTLSYPQDVVISFPDPLPPPVYAAAAAYNTRTTRSARPSEASESSICIVNSAQLVPVILALIDIALNTEAIHEDIEQRVKDGKDAVRDSKEGIRKENDRWEILREKMAKAKDKNHTREVKAKREAHKLQVQGLENALRVVTPAFAPRFEPLGSDLDERIYFALTPGVSEREAALEFITSSVSEGKKKGKKKIRVLGEEEREDLREWSWFVAVWGRRTEILPDDEDGDKERWWAFWEQEEIEKVAEYLSVKYELENEKGSEEGKKKASDVKALTGLEQIRGLVKGLTEYAALLEWRGTEEKYSALDGNVEFGVKSGKGDKISKANGSVSAKNFYGK